MSQAATETKPLYQMVYANKDGTFTERNMQAKSREDAKAEFMGVVRVLGIERGYVMEVENEMIFHSFP